MVKAEIPEALIKGKIRELMKDFEYKLQAQGLNLKDYIKYTGASQEYLENTFRPQAESHVKLSLGLNKVAELEKITVSDKEIEEGLKIFREVLEEFCKK